jgi:hypothetical protein
MPATIDRAQLTITETSWVDHLEDDPNALRVLRLGAKQSNGEWAYVASFLHKAPTVTSSQIEGMTVGQARAFAISHGGYLLGANLIPEWLREPHTRDEVERYLRGGLDGTLSVLEPGLHSLDDSDAFYAYVVLNELLHFQGFLLFARAHVPGKFQLLEHRWPSLPVPW